MACARAALFLCFAFGLSACMSTSSQKSMAVPQDMTQQALQSLNAFRAQNGLRPVVADAGLVRVASRQVEAMASKDVLSHEIDGDFTARINAAGFSQAEAAENVGAGHPAVENAIKAWIASPHHRENMLMKSATRVAVARIDAPQSRYGSYWALEIASGAAKPDLQSGSSLFSMSFLR